MDARSKCALGSCSQRKPGNPEERRRGYGSERRLRRQLGIQPEPHVQYQPDSDWGAFQAGECGRDERRAALPDILLRTVYPGLNTINLHNFVGHTNYHSLQVTMQRRFSHGLAWGLAYTWSKALGSTAFTPVVADNEAWNYGRLSSDRRHNLAVNYSYQLPDAGRKVHSKLLGAFVDHWTLSG